MSQLTGKLAAPSAPPSSQQLHECEPDLGLYKYPRTVSHLRWGTLVMTNAPCTLQLSLLS